jgi:aspartyl aminopeptidase
MEKQIERLVDCLNKSKTAYNFIDSLDLPKEIVVLDEVYSKLAADTTYMIKISSSACVLVKTPKTVEKGMGFNMFAAHTDSPALKLKPKFLLKDSHYTRIATEIYGGPIISSWLDIPLTLAGRVFVKTSDGIEEKVINLKEPLFTIPNMPPHLETTINSGFKYNPQVDLIALAPKDFDLETYLSLEAGSIISHDLFLVPSMKAKVIKDDFIFSNRIDDLACVFVGLESFLAVAPKDKINILCCFDNEEVGSRTKQGADSTLLTDILDLIYESFEYSKIDKMNALKKSFMISADNAHAINPNHPEKFDNLNLTYVNEGIVIKYNANQSYTTDALSASVFKSLCDSLNIPYQEMANRSDTRGGSTLGNIALSHVSIPSVDIGLPQLAMHSTMEVLGQKDVLETIKVIEAYFSK